MDPQFADARGCKMDGFIILSLLLLGFCRATAFYGLFAAEH
jgi:hypothetical protein